MSPITVELPDELAQRLQGLGNDLPKILELGLREWNAASQPGYDGAAAVLEFLASLPTPEEILALRPTAELQARIEVLLDKNGEAGLSPEEQREWEHYRYLEHLVRMAKARALLRTAG